MSTAAPSSETVVRCKTPRGKTTLARVVDREISSSISPEAILTVRALGRTWRVSQSDTSEVEQPHTRV